MFLSFRKFFGGFVAVLFFVFLSQVVSGSTFDDKNPLKINFLNVGQGDAILINYLDRYQILIDGGPEGKVLMYELGKVMPKNDQEIEVVILTHSDWDHFGGMIDLLDYYSVKSFLTNDIENDKESFQKLVNKIKDKNIPVNLPESGSRIDFGEYLDIKFLAPDVDNRFSNGNDNSIVTRLDFGENSFLFTGDIGEKTEKVLVKEAGQLLDVDWLKVAHHGSKNSTSTIFLNKVTPEFGIISVGKDNRYGHPAKEAVERLEDLQIKIFRTDEKGTIKVGCKNIQKNSCRIAN